MSMLRPNDLLVIIMLLVLIVLSAVAVSWSVHSARKLTGQMQVLETEMYRLHTEWGQLQLEQSTWGGYTRVERLAREKLQMRLPAHQDRVVIMP